MAHYNELRQAHHSLLLLLCIHWRTTKPGNYPRSIGNQYPTNCLHKYLAETGSESLEAMTLSRRNALRIVRGLRCTHIREERLLKKVLLGELL